MCRSWLGGSFLMLLAVPLAAENRFVIGGQTFLTGSTDQEVPLLLDNDILLYGLSFGLRYDPEKIQVTAVLNEDTVAAEAQFFSGRIDQERGLVGYGCLFGVGGEDFVNQLPPGEGHVAARLIIDVLADEDTEMAFVFEAVETNPNPEQPVRNVMSDSTGHSVLPAMVSEPLTLETRSPRIESIDAEPGYYEDTFAVVGDFFDEADRVVKVCGSEAQNELLDDGRTLIVTAPPCETVGCVEVEICTERGCVSDPAGFCYLEPPVPAILGFEDNTGRARNEFVILGENLDRERLVVRVCAQEVEHDALAEDGSSIRLRAPECKTLGWAEVEVCTRFGCASATEGFFYLEAAAAPDGIAFDPGQGELQLSWEAQDLDALHLQGYNLYRSDGPGAELVLLHEVPLREASYLDEGLTQGAEYCYRVHTVATNGDESAAPLVSCIEMPVYFKRADSNADGSTDLSDSIYVLNYLFTGAGPPHCFDAADINDDGRFDLSDGVYLLNRLFLGGPGIDAPGIFTCGVDPTEDGLGCESFPPCDL